MKIKRKSGKKGGEEWDKHIIRNRLNYSSTSKASLNESPLNFMKISL